MIANLWLGRKWMWGLGAGILVWVEGRTRTTVATSGRYISGEPLAPANPKAKTAGVP
jgi:hypothetical protein